MAIGQEYSAARRANEMRYAQAMGIYNQIITRSQPGGAVEKAGLAQIETAKTKGVGQEMQQMISSGMYGTTTAAGVPARWESEFGAPARLKLEDIMEQRLTQAQLGKAGFIERREDVYPDVGAVAGYEAKAASAPQGSLQDWMGMNYGGGMSAAKPVAPAGERAYARPTTPTPTPTKAAPTPPPTTRREIPAQRTPAAMGSYLETYTPQTGDYSKVPTPSYTIDYDYYAPKKKTAKPKSVYDEYADYFGF